MTTPAKFAVCVLLGAGIFFAGYMANRQQDPATTSASDRQVANYACPMHPQYRSDRAGLCPVCGMSLESISAGDSSADRDSRTADRPGIIRISAEKQQLIGVHTVVAERKTFTRTLRLLGRVVADETRIHKIKAAADGWVLNDFPNTVGSHVKKGQPLVSIYAADFITPAQSYIIPAGSTGRYGTQVQIAETQLKFLGVDSAQLEEIKRTGRVPESIEIRSPATGFVTLREVSPGLRFQKGDELYRITELDRVWVQADVFEREAPYIRPGMPAKVFQTQLGKEFGAKVANLLPQFDASTRTLKVRIEVNNPAYVLKPDMFVDVQFPIELPPSISVPSDAVVDSGRRKTVYVERERGVFEPRLVETGWRLGDRVQVTHGLEPGERIVVAGNFLIDSESRMKLSDDRNSAPAREKKKVKDLVCGMEIDPDRPNTLKVERDGKTYYFCSASCKTKFLVNPAKYIGKQKADEPKMAMDPVCGMEVDPKMAGVLKTEYKGKTYYFCGEGCKKSFEADPEKYLKKGMAPDSQHMTGI